MVHVFFLGNSFFEALAKQIWAFHSCLGSYSGLSSFDKIDEMNMADLSLRGLD
jgi:hypothetical protein